MILPHVGYKIHLLDHLKHIEEIGIVTPHHAPTHIRGIDEFNEYLQKIRTSLTLHNPFERTPRWHPSILHFLITGAFLNLDDPIATAAGLLLSLSGCTGTRRCSFLKASFGIECSSVEEEEEEGGRHTTMSNFSCFTVVAGSELTGDSTTGEVATIGGKDSDREG